MKHMTALACLAVFLTGAPIFGQDTPSHYEHLKCFDVLIGEWHYKGPVLEESPDLAKGSSMVAVTKWNWILNKNAFELNWRYEFEEAPTMEGKGLFFWDPAEERIMAVGISDRGSHSMAIVKFDDATDTLSREIKGVGSDGSKRTSTILITLTDKDTYVFQAKNRQGGTMTGDSPKYTVKRVK
jgi:hypothetical protein